MSLDGPTRSRHAFGALGQRRLARLQHVRDALRRRGPVHVGALVARLADTLRRRCVHWVNFEEKQGICDYNKRFVRFFAPFEDMT